MHEHEVINPKPTMDNLFVFTVLLEAAVKELLEPNDNHSNAPHKAIGALSREGFDLIKLHRLYTAAVYVVKGEADA